MNTGEDFIYGKSFQWFTGVVEDINDPEEMGRYKIRCFGYHTDDKERIPTESLPWAHVMLPITSASMTGIGQSATGILQGSWVVGFFRDGTNAQDPLILGSIPSKPLKTVDSSLGFNDPDGIYPRKPYVGKEVDTPRAARAQYNVAQPYMSKEDTRQELIETAIPPQVPTTLPNDPKNNKDGTPAAYYNRVTWENRKLDEIINPAYPANHVTETESGHIFEVDDTTGSERLSTYHTSGTYEEIVANGDKTVTVVGDEFEVTFKNKNMYVKGDVNLTVNGDIKTLVKGNYHLEVEGNKTEYIKGNSIEKIGLNSAIEIGGKTEEGLNLPRKRLVNVSGDYNTRIGGIELRDVSKDSTTNITGNRNLAIVLDSKTTISGSSSLTATDNLTINATTGTLSAKAGSKVSLHSATADMHIYAKQNIHMETPANVDIDGARIDLN